MSEHFIFFRCWPGFCDPFPFAEFNDLPDEALVIALESYAVKLLQKAEICNEIREIGKRRRTEFVAAMKRQSQSRLGGGSTPRPKSAATFRQICWPRIRRASRTDPLVCRVGAYLGWWRPEIIGWTLPGPQVWLYETPILEFGQALQAELERQRTLDYDEHKAEIHSNPRFGLIPSKDLSAGKQVSIRMCIKAIRDGREPAVPNQKLALAIGKEALSVARELEDAWPRPAAPDAGNGDQSGGANTTPRKSSPNRKTVKLDHWGIGHDGTEWWLFRWEPNKKQWQEQGRAEIPQGRATKFALELIPSGGRLSREGSVLLFRVGQHKGTPPKKVFDSVAKPARRDLAEAIKTAIQRAAKVSKVGNPLLWDQPAQCWRSELGAIGIARKDENGRLKLDPKDDR